MSISDSLIKVTIGANLRPPAGFGASGSGHIGVELTHAPQFPRTAWSARMIFSAAQSANVDPLLGNIAPSAAGVRQAKAVQIIAGAGATANGNLAVTVTGAGITGSPLALAVPLTTNQHTNSVLIANAVRAKLSATAAITALYDVLTPELAGTSDTFVTIRRKVGAANDATLNIAIAAGLGVSPVPTANVLAVGVLGVVIERLGGDGQDMYGRPIIATNYVDLVLRNPPSGYGDINATLVGERICPTLYPDSWVALGNCLPFGDGDPINITSSGAGEAIIYANGFNLVGN